MYSKRSGLILGFHGCDKSVVDLVSSNEDQSLIQSTNKHDWLGPGIYFWEHSLSRAIEFATKLKNKPRKHQSKPIVNPAAIGAVINLGYCLDLLDIENFELLRESHRFLKTSLGSSMPTNKAIKGGKDLLIRNLDCAVIEAMHLLRVKAGLPPFDSIRCAFWEGKPIYRGAGFKDRNHIQICIINPNCIKGYFIPRKNNIEYQTI